jgi:hypothetical protein
MPVSQSPAREETKSKTMAALLPVEMYVAVDVVDAAGNKANHVIFRARGTKQFYRLLPEGAEKLMRPLAGWLNALVEKELEPSDSGDVVPPDFGTTLPTG